MGWGFFGGGRRMGMGMGWEGGEKDGMGWGWGLDEREAVVFS